MPLKTPANVSGWKAYAASSSLSKLPLKDVHFEDADKVTTSYRFNGMG